MKRMYIGVGLLAVILASAIALSAAFPAMHMPLAETVEKAAEAALAGNWNEAQVLVTKARQEWERIRDFSAAVADHEPLEQMEGLLTQLEVFGQRKDALDFAAVCRQLAALAEAMADSQRITWWNLL